MKIKSYKEIIEIFHEKITISRRLSLSELLLILAILISIPLGILIFKLAIVGKLTWEHIFWFSMLFR